MALLLKKLYKGYFWLFDEIIDHRSDNDFLFASPISCTMLLATYIYTIKVLGPQFMKDRQPFNLKKIIIAYNIIQILLNAYLSYAVSTRHIQQKSGEYRILDKFYSQELTLGSLSVWYLTQTDIRCAEVDYSDTPVTKYVLKCCYLFFYLKCLDLLDTVFFVLKKNQRQVTFLHMYHHWGMVLASWIALRYLCGGESVWVAAINGPVHIFMFMYYLLTAIDSKWKKALWMKKMITQIQLIQFAAFIIIYGRILFLPNCNFPKILCYLFVIQNLFMLSLFGEFYFKTYISTKKSVKQL